VRLSNFRLHDLFRQRSHGDPLDSIFTLEQAILRFGRGKRNGRRVVFTNGCFELLHPGHIRLLEQARAEGDVLIVGIAGHIWSIEEVVSLPDGSANIAA